MTKFKVGDEVNFLYLGNGMQGGARVDAIVVAVDTTRSPVEYTVEAVRSNCWRLIAGEHQLKRGLVT